MSGGTHSLDVDVAIVGSGFAGSLMALALRTQGRSVALIERERHPRFVIGESSTPLANVLLEALCDRYGLSSVRSLSTWGSWQQAHPDLACGLKRGFSFFHHRPGEPYTDDETHGRQLLVAASPHDAVADTHWYRPDVDGWLAREAAAAGAEYLDATVLDGFEPSRDHVTITGSRQRQAIEIRAGFLVDASGPRGFMHRAQGLAAAPLRWMAPTQGLYAHFTDVARWEDVVDAVPGDGAPPYPVDAAALHHVFPGGWIWVLRFDNGVTSAGAALTDAYACTLGVSAGEAAGAAAWSRLMQHLPSVAAQFQRARAVTPFVHLPRMAWRASQVVGQRWAMLPSAAGVIDPLLSTGFPLALLGVHRLLEALNAHWDDAASLARALNAYALATHRELNATEQLVAALYAQLDDFEMFTQLSLLYFAAASFSETARRLGRPERARGFLLCDDAAFSAEAAACAALARTRPGGEARTALLQRISRVIAPWDVAGLGDTSRRRWYPVSTEDLIAARHKVGASVPEVLAMMGAVHA